MGEKAGDPVGTSDREDVSINIHRALQCLKGGQNSLSLTCFVSGGRGGAGLTLAGSAFGKAALIGDIQKRKEVYHFYKS